MTEVHYPYENDDEQLQALSSGISLKRLEDVVPYGGNVLHDSLWWLVTGSGSTEELELEIACPSDPLNPRESRLRGKASDLVVYADAESGLQFQEGVLLDTPWPVGGLIYVADARCRGIGSDPDARVNGIFVLRFEEDGSSYYAPVDPEYQPGVASSWLLSPYRDLILDWRPVDVADLLTRMEAAHA